MRHLLAPMLATAALIAGCGAQEAAAPDTRTDRAAVQARVTTYIAAMLAADGERACAQLTPDYRRETDQRAKAGGIAGCVEAMELYGDAVGGVVPEGFAELASDPRRVAVTLHGNQAAAAMRSPRGGLSIKRTSLQRVDGRWLISGLGITRPRN